MRLKSIKYSQFKGEPNEWSLDPFSLKPLNLIVGKNASGKTRSLNVINNLAWMLKGKKKPNFLSGYFDAIFEQDEKKYSYVLNVEKGKVVKEEFKIDNKDYLIRGSNGEGKIYAEKLDKKIDFQTPVTELAFIARRDAIQHSYFEPLYEWAHSAYYYPFGTALGQTTYLIFTENKPLERVDSDQAENVTAIFLMGEKKYKINFKKNIRNDLKKIGYEISDIGVDVSQNISLTGAIPKTDLYGLWIKEKGIKNKIAQQEISQGMFRVLSLVIQLNYLVMAHKPSCIIIDDIGEGLDFERSCSLIELLIAKAQSSKIQLIMATNDRFVMNKVPLEMWAVLKRNGVRSKVYTYENSKEKFKEFEFTGLNNFDFFATNYLDSD